MKKCSNCDIVFSLDERTRCLYCNALLMTVEAGADTQFTDSKLHDGFQYEDTLIEKVINDRRQVLHDRKQYIVGSYFCTRTIHFMYCFSRNEFKMDRSFKRVLIQPLNLGSFLILPWVVFNLIDSFFFRILYGAYCPTCGWKFKMISSKGGHDPVECEYNQEYTALIQDILSGKIIENEEKYKQASVNKIEAGRRSAYKDLCTNRDFFSSTLDITCVWFSISLILVGFVVLVFPFVGLMFQKMGDISPLGLR